MKNTTFDYKDGITTCTINYEGKIITTQAKCHPDDADLGNQNTGCEIAYRRAMIIICRLRRDEIKAGLKALNQLYYSMKHSKKFNPKNYEIQMLKRQIQIHEDDLAVFNNLIDTERKNLKRYIDKKDEFYKDIRAHRQANNK